MSADGATRGPRAANRRRVISALRAHGGMTRSELGTVTGLSRATISTLLSELLEQGLVIEAPPEDSEHRRAGAGRPAAVVRLDSAAGAALSVDVGARHLAVAVGDLGHRVLAERWVPLPPGHRAGETMTTAVRLAAEALDEAGVGRDAVVGVGMGLPAPISQPAGTVASSNILPGWAGVKVAEEMSERLELPVFVDNDANLGALAESTWGAGAGWAQVAYIKVATGIGGAMVQDGRLFRGTSGTAGEVGHTTVAEDGPICRCGNRGCLELYAGGGALLEALRAGHPDVDTLDELVRRAHDGDPACTRVLADSGRHIGVAIANLINLVNPGRIIVGGELSRAGEMLLGPMRVAAARSAIQTAVDAVEIVPGTLGHRAEMLGGLAVVLREPWRFEDGAPAGADARVGAPVSG